MFGNVTLDKETGEFVCRVDEHTVLRSLDLRKMEESLDLIENRNRQREVKASAT